MSAMFYRDNAPEAMRFLRLPCLQYFFRVDELLGSVIPIDHVEPCGHIIDALVLIFQIVSVFPHVDTKEREAALRERRVLVGSDFNPDFLAVGREPCPTAAELSQRGFGEDVFERRKAGVFALDGFAQAGSWLIGAVFLHHFPEDGMVVMAAGIVANRGADVFRNGRNI